MTSPFQNRKPAVKGNPKVRIPQQEAYESLEVFANDPAQIEREVGIILPVGCGKSGCIALTPFAFGARRALVVAPGLVIAGQLHKDFDPSNPTMFYITSATLSDAPFPEPVEIRGTTTNIDDLNESHVVITNIQQLQGAANRWLQDLPPDFFDLILVDEGHHNVASSWDALRVKFPEARIVNFSATPLRADGQLMAGKILYSYPVFRAIQEGYVKRLKAIVLNPQSLRFVRDDNGVESDVTLDEVRKLGEEDADFRRSIVTSTETLSTIVDASIRELQRLRAATGETRLKIIASALNQRHCQQIVAAYRARGLRVEYVHSKEDGAANRAVMNKLENHEIDAIVQVRKLGEGFDHKYLSVAAVFSIFGNLSPFVQFVGRIMRVIKQNAPGDSLNQGVVVFHAGANVARRWQDFQTYSEADQAFFDQLLPMEGLDFSTAAELEVEPMSGPIRENPIRIQGQGGVRLEEIPLIENDPEALEALRLLRDKGYSGDQIKDALEELKPIPITKVRERQAKRLELAERVKEEAGRLLGERSLSHEGGELDKKRLGRSNYVVVTAAINKRVNDLVGHAAGQRHEMTKPELERVETEWRSIIDGVRVELFHG